MKWEMKEKLIGRDLFLEFKEFKKKFNGGIFSDSNGIKFRVYGTSITVNRGKVLYDVSYCLLDNENITHTMELSEFLDGRFSEI